MKRKRIEIGELVKGYRYPVYPNSKGRTLEGNLILRKGRRKLIHVRKKYKDIRLMPYLSARKILNKTNILVLSPRFVYVDEIQRLHNKPTHEDAPRETASYSVSRHRSKDAQKIGNVWIKSIDKTAES